ncbi:MAG: phage tail protein [Ilumatobacter sp.]|jgi:phage tail-like protein|uniref:phage tail protein n=1 Tax=Ilumatobacter sp. TaxID=1967498 RepID=UPI0039191571
MPDPYEHGANSARFLFEVDGLDIGWFNEVSGLEVSIETEEVQEGGQNSFVHKLPGRMTWPNISLKRGFTRQDNLLAWLNEASGEQFAANGNKLKRKSAAITLLDGDGTRLRSWEFDEAYPVKWSGPTFAASNGEAASEQLEITHHGFRAREH